MSAVKVLVFAGARDAVGVGELSLPLDLPLTARQLLDRLCELYPALAPRAASIRVAVNGVYAAWDEPVSPGDEVAIIPPVAGG
jgi:molybdopterin synthase catalytic subunit/molybdopterin synthase sulfur carrier subunit